VSLRIVDDHDAFPAEVVERSNEEQSQRVEVGADTRQQRELDETIDGVVAGHRSRRQHRHVPVTRPTPNHNPNPNPNT